MNKKISGQTKWLKTLIILSTLGICGYMSVASAAISTITLSSVLQNMTTTSKDIAGILQDICLVVGIGFIIAGIFKAHQHKNNPTQVTFGNALTLVIIGAALIMFPYLLKLSAKSILGTTTLPKLGGKDIGSLIGS
ncbi:MAG: hypothetical protein A2298_04450 [Gammaproteobacteria bacterium RIFOXYB2_FULL_38_6]|nr:MAG: hypothetical protein A2298_04450 [Gammaproteobacteria bacterium RIFOXYB2_FULL_38_6]